MSEPDDLCDCLIPYLEGAGQHSPGCAAVLYEVTCPRCGSVDRGYRDWGITHAERCNGLTPGQLRGVTALGEPQEPSA